MTRPMVVLAVLLAMMVPAPILRAAPTTATAPTTAPIVTGEVTDMEARPVAGAEVVLIRRLYTGMPLEFRGVEVVSRATTDDRGQFQLLGVTDADKNHYMIRATAPGYAYGLSSYGFASSPGKPFYDFVRQVGHEHPSIVLPPAGRVVGVVVDEQGDPVKDAEVTAGGQVDDIVRTDAEGKFVLAPVSATRFGPFYDSTRITVRRAGYVLSEATLTDVIAGKDKSLRIEIERGVIVTGKLTDADTGNPIPNLSLIIRGGDRAMRGRSWSAVSREDGTYEARVPNARLTIEPWNWGSGSAFGDYYCVDERKALDPDDHAAGLAADFKFKRGCTITGRVSNAPTNGEQFYVEAVPEGEKLEQPRQRFTSERVEKDGTFKIRGQRPGKYVLLMFGSGRGRGRQDLARGAVELKDPTVPAEAVINVPAEALAARGVTVRGALRYADGRPAANARVQLETVAYDEKWSFGPTTTSGSDGTFTLEGVDDHQAWTLWAYGATGTDGAAIVLRDAASLGRPIELTLVEGAEYSGTVTTEEGKPLSGYSVTIADVAPHGQFTAHRTKVSGTTDEQGRFVLRGFVPPEGAREFVLEARPDPFKHTARMSIGPVPYKNLDARPRSKHPGYDFVASVENRGMTLRIRPTGPAAQAANPTTREAR